MLTLLSPWELVKANPPAHRLWQRDSHIEHDNTAAQHPGKREMWTWQLPCHRIWRVVAGEPCATVPMRLIHCVLVYLAPVHSCVTATGAQPSTPCSMSLSHTNFRAMFYSAQQWFPFRKAGYLTAFLLFSTHCITSPKLITTPLFFFFTVSISPFEWFSLVLGSVALRDKVFNAEAMKLAHFEGSVTNLLWLICSFALSEIYGNSFPPNSHNKNANYHPSKLGVKVKMIS